MNLEKQVIEAISQITGIPAPDISRDKFIEKDLSISPEELADIISELDQKLGFKTTADLKEIKTVQDLIISVHDSQPIA